MRKYLYLVCIIMILLLVGCETPHTHEFIEGVCECGEEETRSIAINGEHDFTYGFCQYCVL